jgi:hypothetical protein
MGVSQDSLQFPVFITFNAVEINVGSSHVYYCIHPTERESEVKECRVYKQSGMEIRLC